MAESSVPQNRRLQVPEMTRSMAGTVHAMTRRRAGARRDGERLRPRPPPSPRHGPTQIESRSKSAMRMRWRRLVEEVAPSGFPLRVTFEQVAKGQVGPYAIHRAVAELTMESDDVVNTRLNPEVLTLCALTFT